jgi:hypothetical protein
VNNDAIVRTSYYKYFNPKEALVSDGIVNRALSELGGGGASGIPSITSEKNELAAQSMHFVYPFGATLNVQKPSVPVLSSGTVCYPIKRPLCAVYGLVNNNNSLPPGTKKSIRTFSDFRFNLYYGLKFLIHITKVVNYVFWVRLISSTTRIWTRRRIDVY